MTAATKVQWRIQSRKSRDHAWKNVSGLYETRSSARFWQQGVRASVGFGNTRVVRYVKGEK